MLLEVLCVLSLSQGRVRVVDAAGGPGTDFTSLRAATLAADDGDVLLVRSGNYPIGQGPLLVGKGLTILAEEGAQVTVTHLQIADLPATSQVLVRGIHVQSVSGEGPLAVELSNNQGPLWFESFTLETPLALDHGQGGVQSVSDAALVFVRSQLQGPNPAPFIPGPHSLSCIGGRTHLFETRIDGTRVDRSLAFLPTGALDVVGGFLEAYGCEIRGAAGRDGFLFLCPESGFDGLVLRSAAHAKLFDTRLSGGAAGGGTPTISCTPTQTGQASIVIEGSTLDVAAGASRSLSILSPLRADETLQVTLVGQPGDSVWIRYSLRAGQGLSSSQWDGELLLGAPRSGQFVGTIPASGTLSVNAPAPAPFGGSDSLVLFAQAAFRSSSGRFTLSSPSTLVVLDARF
ncbi:MAG: hypothetical protein EXS08_03910 [Planctomycetes bacterium]|nr:hypothetical protein [Planctomycetota bacterium]